MALLAGDDPERMLTTQHSRLYFDVFDRRQGRRLFLQLGLETIQHLFWAFDFDEHAATVVADKTSEPQSHSESIYVRTKTDPLHDPAHAQPPPNWRRPWAIQSRRSERALHSELTIKTHKRSTD